MKTLRKTPLVHPSDGTPGLVSESDNEDQEAVVAILTGFNSKRIFSCRCTGGTF